MEQILEKTIEFELDVNPARGSDGLDFVIKNGFNKFQPFDYTDDEAFGGKETPDQPPFFEQFTGNYPSVAKRATELNQAQLQSGFMLWQFSVKPAEGEES